MEQQRRNTNAGPARTVLAAFLGTSPYKACRYRLGAETSGVVTYVQTALAELVDGVGRCLVFCTEEARAKNWEGLKAEFASRGLPPPEKVDIPNGDSVGKLWEIFTRICDRIEEGDGIVFDVTHSLRSLPVVATVLLGYLATVKKTRLVGCYYGAFEALGTPWDIEARIPAPEDRVAPVFDLTSFFALDDWTAAIADFREDGSARRLKALVNRSLGPVLRDDASLRPLNAAIGLVAQFGDNVRLGNLAGLLGLPLRENALPALRSPAGTADGLLPALRPVLGQLHADLAGFGADEVRNGLFVAEWAARHDLIPQAYTMLQETLLTHGVRSGWFDAAACRPRPGRREAKEEVLRRAYVGDLLVACNQDRNRQPPYDWGTWPHGDPERARALARRVPEGLPELFMRTKARRNALNHGGTNPGEPVKVGEREYSAAGFAELLAEVRRALGEPPPPAPAEAAKPPPPVLVGNAFSLTLVREGEVRIAPCPLEELTARLRAGAEVHSFWGHENTRAAAERLLGTGLAPRTPRPALVPSPEHGGRPMLDGVVFDECWVLSPNYAPGYRPAIGEEVDESRIGGWRLLRLTWCPPGA